MVALRFFFILLSRQRLSYTSHGHGVREVREKAQKGVRFALLQKLSCMPLLSGLFGLYLAGSILVKRGETSTNQLVVQVICPDKWKEGSRNNTGKQCKSHL